jgi:AraC family transcriptional activator of pobA
MKDIPVHQLQSRSTTGLEIVRFEKGDIPKEQDKMGAHRDDHYIFFLLEEGYGSLMMDFDEVGFCGPGLYYVLPGQVHHRIRNEMATGWFVAVDTLLVPSAQRNVFENQLLLQQPVPLNEQQLNQYNGLLCLLRARYQAEDQGAFYLPVVHALLQSFIGMVAGCYYQAAGGYAKVSRLTELSQQFKSLLVVQVRNVHSPADYAAQLNVSESYLNEVLKKTTGLPVSYWIQHEILLEAKRLLYYSDLNVKEIAHALGYDDHTYFSRQFKRVAGITPLAFRGQYRK